MLIVGNIEAPALEGSALGNFSWLLLLVLGAILAYYVVATLLPVDKIIGRLYPVFGVLLFFMAAGMLCVLLFSGDYPIPELTSRRNCIHDPQRFPIVPMLLPRLPAAPCRVSMPRSRPCWPAVCNRKGRPVQYSTEPGLPKASLRL